MHRFIVRFERSARNGVLLVYLSALFLATATYFVGHAIGVGGDLLWYVAIAEACAVEVHSFLAQRLARELHEQLTAPGVAGLPYGERDRIEGRYHLHLRITIGLVGFSVFNSIAFWATMLHPRTLTDWAQVALRGAVIPIAFLCAGFLTPLRESAEGALQDAGGDLTRVMVKHATRQWRARVRQARRRGANLAEPVAVLLEMREGGGMPASVMVRMMDAAIRTAEDGDGTHPALPSAAWRPITPPTGPGTPAAGGRANTRAGDAAGAGLALVAPDGRAGIRRANAARLARIQRRRADHEQRVMAWLLERPDLAKREVARRLRVSESHASDLVNTVRERLASQAGQRMAQ